VNADLLLRAAVSADYPSFARLFPELEVGDPVPPVETWGREIAPHTTVVERGGEVVAYCYAPALHGTGHVRHLVVAPGERGQKLGLTLMRDAAARFREAGCTRWALNVKPHNTAALRLYEGLGMVRVLRSTALRLGWDRVAGLPAPVIAGQVREALPAQYAAIEQALSLFAGQIALAAEAGTRVLRWIEGPAGQALAFGAFDPAFPGSSPFRTATPDQARPLLEAFRPHALPGQTYLQFFVEGDQALREALVEAGAEIRLEALRLEGPLPPPD
jgi:GNAT superfamily N-acetyltransferase